MCNKARRRPIADCLDFRHEEQRNDCRKAHIAMSLEAAEATPAPAGHNYLPGKRSSKLISGAGFELARVVVKPIQRPRKMMLIQSTSDKAAVA